MTKDCKLHRFACASVLPDAPMRFTYPFHYVPHALSVMAAEEVCNHINSDSWLCSALAEGKMLGVLVVANSCDEMGFLAAFSGNVGGKNDLEYFVPPIYDMLDPNGEFKRGEAQIDVINRQVMNLEDNDQYLNLKSELDNCQLARDKEIEQYKHFMAQARQQRDFLRTHNLSEDEQRKLIAESQFQKAELRRIKRRHNELITNIHSQLAHYDAEILRLKQLRRQSSEDLQQRVFTLFEVSNARGERKNLVEIFEQFYNEKERAGYEHKFSKLPPSGAGECCAPKLLQYAYDHNLKPLCMAEFWWGESPEGEVRHHGNFYPACRSKCLPILSFMLQGLDVEDNELAQQPEDTNLEVIWEDDSLMVVNKPAGLQSVPGKLLNYSVESIIRAMRPSLESPLVVHRLDMETSGLMLIAKTKDAHKNLQHQFATHTIQKCYVALLNGLLSTKNGIIDLPIRPNPDDRPRQIVDYEHSKPTITRYEVIGTDSGITRVLFYPLTGRTHQLRVHAAHKAGLGVPIVGDRLYGTPSTRLFLHAQSITFTHPVTGKKIKVERKADF